MGSVYQTVFGGNPVAPAIPTYLSLSFGVNTVLGWPLESNITSPAVAEWIDCSATAPALTLQLSDARQVSTGYTAIFNNVGANTFGVLDAQGNTLMSPASGTAWILILSDNSTLQGTWRALQLGAGTSTANAAALAGNGLKAVLTTLNERIFINAQATNYAIQTTDRASCVEWTGGSGGTFTTPTAAAAGSDWFCYIKNSGTGVLTVAPGSGNIDGTANKTFNPNDSCIVVCDGANFFTMGFGQSVASSFNFVTISLAGATGTVVLTGAQLNRISYKFTGLLAGNTVVQVPASIQQYWVDNETTGAFTLTISAGGAGTTFAVPQANRVILYCDGLNIVNAITGGGVQFGDGTAAAPSITFASDTTLGFYKAGADVLGISTAGVQRGTINANGQWAINAPASGITLSVVGLQGVNTQFSGPNTGAGWNIDFLDTTNAAFRGFIGIGTNTVGGAAVTDFAVSPGAAGSVVVGTANGGAIATRFGPNGNVTINAPSSGVALTLNAVAAQAAVNSAASATNFALAQFAGNANTFGSTDMYVGQLGDNRAALINRANADTVLGTNNTTRVTIGSAGNITVGAPGSGASLLVNLLGGVQGFELASPGASSVFSIGWNVGLTSNAWNIFSQSTDPLTVGTAGGAAFSLSTAAVVRVAISSSGVVTLPSGVQPAFYATENAGQTLNSGATTTLAFNTAQFNQGANYNTGTGTFTAPVAGIYLFTCMLWLQNNAAGNATISCWFQVNASVAGTNQIIPVGFTINAASQQAMYTGSVTLKLNAADTVKIVATVGTNNLQHGSAGSNQSSFCGYLLG